MVFVPALAGLGCPHWEPSARGTWLGLSLDHTPGQLVQSILEGVAFRSAEVIEAMHACIPLNDALFIDGGMSQNPYFVQCLANVTNREIRPASMPELTGLGTVRLACETLGYEPELVSHFGSVAPDAIDKLSINKFKQAVAISQAWSKK